MYKKFLTLFLSLMIIGLNSTCLMSFSHAMADASHSSHEAIAELDCVDCDTPNSDNTMLCCFDTDAKKISATASIRIQSEDQELGGFSAPGVSHFDPISTKQHIYLALAYKPPLIRVGITVKKE
ncbi:hypothetical protein KBB08_02620 [Candidatus Gracilibacteria bacterium]|nr:hypothetical protein [Candidatus Gracilibacteria bacterium]